MHVTMCYTLLLSLRIATSEEEKQVLSLLQFWESPHLLGGVLRVLCNIYVMYGVRLRNHGGFSWVVTEAQEQLPSLGCFALCPKSFARSAGGLVRHRERHVGDIPVK